MFSIFKRAKRDSAMAVANTRHYQIAQESAQILSSTLNPRTFFGRCDDIAYAEESVSGRMSRFRMDTQVHTQLQIAFIDRLIDADRRSVLDEAVRVYHDRWTEEALDYYEARKQELE